MNVNTTTLPRERRAKVKIPGEPDLSFALSIERDS